ncbi:MAG: TetR/AcrR family transcriptional regulator [Deltaproteobacteria bacterium]|nr:TetR/AcrR family transcriptional regulator [Deltaproteobacteria bacterium]MBW2291842.1 TetR/AcrR family transcriptional regulator [Deltaproteobacteria bacterium]MBW2391327.1 TetR/AcrR family transcriptional regulator [Deltaproteobacteria bacterium]
MGRKSLQAVRRTQILDACEEIVLEEGLASASPARVAGRVGLDRTTLHHYFRTRSDLLGGLVERIVDGYLADVRAVQAERGSNAGVAEILDFLLSPAFSRPDYDRILDEFSAASYEDAEVRKQLRRLFATLEEFTVTLLLKAVPDVAPERVRETAYTMYALIEGAYLLHALGFPDDRLRAARRTAHELVEALQREAQTHAPGAEEE